MAYVRDNQLDDKVNIQATFCFENCGQAPNVKIGDSLLSKCTLESVIEEVDKNIK